MRGQTPSALFAIVVGTLETAGGLQEFINRGLIQSLTPPLCIGALGTLVGAFLLATGVAMLLRSPRTDVLISATAWLSVPVFIISGVVYRYAGWPITVVGIAYPLLLVGLNYKPAKAAPRTA